MPRATKSDNGSSCVDSQVPGHVRAHMNPSSWLSAWPASGDGKWKQTFVILASLVGKMVACQIRWGRRTRRPNSSTEVRKGLSPITIASILHHEGYLYLYSKW